ncbi:MAG: carbon starvation protein A [Methanomicrobium sp.]|nr:carbon starvation protein A [Methanomicrobium sp.]
MILLAVCLICLLLGYLVYGKFTERMILPFRETTPAIAHPDGMDYVPMSGMKNHLIELLNIAGTGPIFGALMGAKWGPIVFIWIVAGCILGGAVHDYMSGMMSARNDGKSTSYLIRHYIGESARYPILILIIFVMIMVTATFARSASDLLSDITGLPSMIWIALILAYFIISTVLPIHKVIGRIYPVFGVLLILMAVTVIGGLALGGYPFPTFTLENLNPAGQEFFPDMLITVACGAISGFHATQAPMTARCLKDERDGRKVFYGAMVVESVIALFWATAALAFYESTAALADALGSGGASGVVYDIAVGVAGPVGGLLAVIGVIICPITSGDTALRSSRLMIQDDRNYDSSKIRNGITITAVLMMPIIFLCSIDFSILWNYFSWLNQTLACLVLWTAAVFIISCRKKVKYSLIAALPAVFMTMAVSTFILHSGLGLSLDYGTSIAAGVIITAAITLTFVKYFIIDKRAYAID